MAENGQRQRLDVFDGGVGPLVEQGASFCGRGQGEGGARAGAEADVVGEGAVAGMGGFAEARGVVDDGFGEVDAAGEHHQLREAPRV